MSMILNSLFLFSSQTAVRYKTSACILKITLMSLKSQMNKGLTMLDEIRIIAITLKGRTEQLNLSLLMVR